MFGGSMKPSTNRHGVRLDGLAERLSAENRAAILRLKGEVWQHPGYRRSFSSQDVYRAVLDDGIRDVEEFWVWLRQRGVTVQRQGR